MATSLEEAWPGLESQLLGLKPDLVLIALGVPRQETWSQAIGSGAAGLWMGVGGSFDVWAGVKTRAPRWMGRFQIEWLYRLIQEPSRWRRMLSLPQFVWEVIREGERSARWISGSRRRPARQKPAKGKHRDQRQDVDQGTEGQAPEAGASRSKV